MNNNNKSDLKCPSLICVSSASKKLETFQDKHNSFFLDCKFQADTFSGWFIRVKNTCWYACTYWNALIFLLLLITLYFSDEKSKRGKCFPVVIQESRDGVFTLVTLYGQSVHWSRWWWWQGDDIFAVLFP